MHAELEDPRTEPWAAERISSFLGSIKLSCLKYMDETGYTVHCHAIHFADNSPFPPILFYQVKRSNVPVVGEHRAPSKRSSTYSKRKAHKVIVNKDHET